eukprot:11131909-Alexandrium_andersonii.AAC.1
MALQDHRGGAFRHPGQAGACRVGFRPLGAGRRAAVPGGAQPRGRLAARRTPRRRWAALPMGAGACGAAGVAPAAARGGSRPAAPRRVPGPEGDPGPAAAVGSSPALVARVSGALGLAQGAHQHQGGPLRPLRLAARGEGRSPPRQATPHAGRQLGVHLRVREGAREELGAQHHRPEGGGLLAGHQRALEPPPHREQEERRGLRLSASRLAARSSDRPAVGAAVGSGARSGACARPRGANTVSALSPTASVVACHPSAAYQVCA